MDEDRKDPGNLNFSSQQVPHCYCILAQKAYIKN